MGLKCLAKEFTLQKNPNQNSFLVRVMKKKKELEQASQNSGIRMDWAGKKELEGGCNILHQKVNILRILVLE